MEPIQVKVSCFMLKQVDYGTGVRQSKAMSVITLVAELNSNISAHLKC